jgi:hypothetical protein
VRKLRCPPNTLKNFSNYFPSRAIMPLARRALQTPTSLRWGVMPVLGTPTINYAILFSVLDIEATPMVTIKMASISQIFV